MWDRTVHALQHAESDLEHKLRARLTGDRKRARERALNARIQLSEDTPMADMTGMTAEQMLARIAELEKQVARKAPSQGIKVSEKGAVSFYGVGRFPVTLYKSQWEILFANVDNLKAFIAENDSKLSQGKKEPQSVTTTTTASATA